MTSLTSKLTDSLVPGVQELGEGRRGSLALDHLCALLVGRQLAQHARRHALHVLDLVVEQLKETKVRCNSFAQYTLR